MLLTIDFNLTLTSNNWFLRSLFSSFNSQGLLGKVSRFQSLSQRANKSFPDALAPIEPDVETARLEDVKDDQLSPKDTE